ncbi:ANTAR domain-containing protein [Streptomyces sp. NPDC016845]|uniref:ANTAR domain-containing protein n=1 Tax=Streptomyces sp. NPDC016845 TaxID=3364972 RepID=UPI0037AC3AD7
MTFEEAQQPADSHPPDADARVAELEREVAQLKEAVVSHADVDRAVGVLIAVARISPADAFDVLREVLMRLNIKLRRVALLTVRWGQSGVLPVNVRTELYRHLCARSDVFEPGRGRPAGARTPASRADTCTR